MNWRLSAAAKHRRADKERRAIDRCVEAAVAAIERNDPDGCTGAALRAKIVALVRTQMTGILVQIRQNAREEALRDALQEAQDAGKAVPADWTMHEWKYGWKQGASEAFNRIGSLIAPELRAARRSR